MVLETLNYGSFCDVFQCLVFNAFIMVHPGRICQVEIELLHPEFWV